jgi:hypothetical protein
MLERLYLQGDDARHFLSNGYCEGCLSPARKWAVEDRYGNIIVHGLLDEYGNLYGFVCPNCATKTNKVERLAMFRFVGK